MKPTWQERFGTMLFEMVSAVCRLRRPKPADQQLRAQQWRHSVQRMPLRFNERIRDVWRTRWLRLHRPDDGDP
ncbi:MAG: hypothetical protein ACE5K7_05645 [Phycisphaerae bacterium]